MTEDFTRYEKLIGIVLAATDRLEKMGLLVCIERGYIVSDKLLQEAQKWEDELNPTQDEINKVMDDLVGAGILSTTLNR